MITKNVGAYWNKAAAKLLEGKQIVEARYMTEQEAEDQGWDRRPLVLFLEGGLCVFASQDDEGNGPGALFTDDEKHPGFPVLS